MRVRRASDEDAKRIGEFDIFTGDRRVDGWRGELLVCVDEDRDQADCDGRRDGAGVVVGFITFSSNVFYNRPFIGFLLVREGHRRRGVAAALVRRVLEIYDGLDVWVSTEQGNEPAIRFFEKLGFEPKGRVEGLDHERSVELFFRRPARRLTE